MTILFLYGPPAVGKLTIGNIISQTLNWTLVHNHLAYDPVIAIADRKDPGFWEAKEKITSTLIELAVKNKKNVIVTIAYGKYENDAFVQKLVEQAKALNQETVFIELAAEFEELLERVDNESRKQFKKLTNKEFMKEAIENYYCKPIPFVESEAVQTQNRAPQEVAQQIISLIKNRTGE